MAMAMVARRSDSGYFVHLNRRQQTMRWLVLVVAMLLDPAALLLLLPAMHRGLRCDEQRAACRVEPNRPPLVIDALLLKWFARHGGRLIVSRRA